MKRCTLLALLLSSMPILVSSSPLPEGFKEDGEYKSQSEKTVVRAYRKELPPVGIVQMRAFQEGDANKDGELLWEGENRPWAVVSFDGEAIAINQHAGSDTGLMFVFVRQKNGGYQKVDLDFRDEALKLFAHSQHFKSEPDFDHLYCYAETWLAGHYLLAKLSGHMSGKYRLDEFWFIYDCATRKFSFELNSLNKAGFHPIERR